jgi:hypothetical protein
MRIHAVAIASAIAALSVSAQAATIAGWDFSQWLGAGVLSTDGATATNRLSANYSSLDPTNNAGAESAAFGTLYFDGQHGSTHVTAVGDGSEAFTPAAGSLASNIGAPVAKFGDNPFDSLGILGSEGQKYTELLSMAATGPLDVVFAADLSSVPQTASDWQLTFGGRSGISSPLAIAYSTNGVDYVSAGSVTLGTADTPFSVSLGQASGKQMFVRLSFSPTLGAAEGAQFIDNVAIGGAVTPGPATLGLLLAGLSGLALARSRKRGY